MIKYSFDTDIYGTLYIYIIDKKGNWLLVATVSNCDNMSYKKKNKLAKETLIELGYIK